MKKCSFLIVCLVWLVACSAPRQVTLQLPTVVTVHDTIRVETPVPATDKTEDFVFDEWNGGDFMDILTVEDETSKATVVATGDTKTKKRTYKVTTERKADTIRIMVPVTIRDTIQIECPPTLPAMPTDGKFPWWWLLGLFGALTVWWIGRKKK